MVDLISIENLEPLKEIIAQHKEEPGCIMPILQKHKERMVICLLNSRK